MPKIVQCVSRVPVFQSVHDKLVLRVGEEQLAECRNAHHISYSGALIFWLWSRGGAVHA